MNNYRKVYRVEHNTIKYALSDIGVGPYRFFSLDVMTAIRALPPQATIEDLKECNELSLRYEPYQYHLKPKGQFKPGKTLPASDRWIRPGPREDPLLREYLKKNYLVNPEDATSGVNDKFTNDPFIFAFDSMEQLNSWFFCEKEKAALNRLGFVIKTHKFKSSDVVLGRSQCLCKIRGIYNRANAFLPMITSLVPQPA